jgi:hypothetical protein
MASKYLNVNGLSAFDTEDATNLAHNMYGSSYKDVLFNDPNSEQAKMLASQLNVPTTSAITAGNVTDYTGLGASGGLTGYNNPSGQKTGLANWFEDRGNQFMVHTGFGLANLGLGLASYLQQSDFMKKQGKVLDQQIANNDYNMNKQRTFDTERKAAYARLNPTSNVG